MGTNLMWKDAMERTAGATLAPGRPSGGLGIPDRNVRAPRALVVPAPAPASVFGRHKQTVTPFAILGGLVAVSLPFVLAIPVLASFGLLPALVIGPLGVLASVALFDRSSMFGNRRLERALATQLGIGAQDGWEFVGIASGEANEPAERLRRSETDDNVGMLTKTRKALIILLEGSKIAIARNTVRGISLEPLPDCPLLFWVRVERFDDDGNLDSILLMARSANSLAEIGERTKALYRELVEWHFAGLESLADC